MKLILCLILAMSAMAKDAEPKKAKKGKPSVEEQSLRFRKDMPGSEGSLSSQNLKGVKLEKQNSSISFTESCKSEGGLEYKRGEAGYDSCLKDKDIYVPTGSENKYKKD